MLYSQAGLLAVWVHVVRRNVKEHRERRPRSGVRRLNAELQQVACLDLPGRSRNPDDTLRAQRAEDVVGRRRTRRLDGSKHLCDLAKAVDLAQGVDHVIDLVVNRRVIDAVSPAHNRGAFAKRIPGE